MFSPSAVRFFSRRPRSRFAAWWPALVVAAALALPASADPLTPASVPRFTHPGAGQTFYFVLTDRFANGSAANDQGGLKGGPDQTGFDPSRISHYHGGDFAGLTAHLDYLQKLGITAVWVTPPFRNKAMQLGTAGYHGYWITDFLAIDPHLGTNDEYREFIRQAHARGMRVYMDIVVNHTADVIQYADHDTRYRDKAAYPYRDAEGKIFDDRAVAYNGLNSAAAFPRLSAARSFPHVPVIPAGEENAKNPAWLNDVTVYHNRGNSTFQGENAVYGDFVGLDDVFTEQPRVVHGFIDVFRQWLDYGVDGYRIDTVRHVNAEFWQAFSPAIRARARELGRPDFLQFGEVYNDPGDPAVLSEFSTGTIPIDTTTDFGFFGAAKRFVSQGGTAEALADFFARDDYYTDHDSNVHSTTTFLGNHDAGRFAHFLQEDNPGASPELLADLVRLGHGLLLLSRGQPVVYYGDEQGMIGRGGGDMQAREDMFAAQAPEFKSAPLLGTTRTGADEKFDENHPFYRLIARLGALRRSSAALRTGAMIPRPTAAPALFAFSRIDRREHVEYLVALNNSHAATVRVSVPTSQPAGAVLSRVFDSRHPDSPAGETLTAGADGTVTVSLPPLQFAVWRAEAQLPAATAPLAIALTNPAAGAELKFTTREVDGLTFPSRHEIRAEVSGNDGLAEVTFALRRSSRPGQLDVLGIDDAPPYRIFWEPPPDLQPGEELEFIATVNDLRGKKAVALADKIRVAPSAIAFGIKYARTPAITAGPMPEMQVAAGARLELAATATGSGDLEYQWLHDGEAIPGAVSARLAVPDCSATQAGEYRVLVHNLAGTALSAASNVTVTGAGRIEKHAAFPSRFVAPREVDVWLPPEYDAKPESRFPVVYLEDGQNAFDRATSYTGVAWEVDRAVNRLSAAKKIAPAIVVGLWNTGATRTAEYVPQKAMPTGDVKDVTGVFNPPSHPLLADAYLRFVVEELKPFIDRTYRTLPDADHTFAMGSSMGGLISAYAVAEYPQVFGGAACLSTHWPAQDGALIDYLAAHLPAPGRHRWYFDLGTATLDASYGPYQARMDAVMRKAGYVDGRDWITRTYPGAEHSETAWRARVDVPLEFLLGK